MDMYGDSQEDEEAAEDELQFFTYVQDEVLEVKILEMTKASDSVSKIQRGPGYEMPTFAVVRTPGLSPESTGTSGQVDADQVFLEGLCASLSWTATQQHADSKKAKPFTILWSDTIPLDASAELERIKRLHSTARCNHFPEIEQLLDKCYLCTNLELLSLTLGEHKLIQPSWPLPMRYNHLKMKIESSSEDRYKSKPQPAPTFVVKFGKNNRGVNEPLSPDTKSRAVSRHHMGSTRPRSSPEPISDKPMLTQTTPNRALFSTRMCVAQLFVPNPYLLGGKAGSVFRLRTFALITSVHPHMRAFLYREGVVCLAQEAFDPPSASTLDMHDKYIVDRKRFETWATVGGGKCAGSDSERLPNGTEDDWTSAYFESDGEDDTAASATAGPTADVANNLRDIEKRRRTRGAGGRPGELLAGGGDGRLPESSANKHLRYQRQGKTWTLSALLLHFHEHGHDVDKFWSSIQTKVQKVLLCVKDQLQTAYCGSRGNNDVGFSCFELVAFDFVVDMKMEGWVVDVDPVRFDVFSSQDILVKSTMMKEALQLVAADPHILLGVDEKTARLRSKKLKLSSSLSKRLRSQSKPASTSAEATSNNNEDDGGGKQCLPDELGPKDWARLSRKRKEYEDTYCDGFARILPVLHKADDGAAMPEAATDCPKGVDSEKPGVPSDPLEEFWDYTKKTNVTNATSFERKNYSRLLRESRNLAKQQEQQREIENAERAKSTAKFTQKMKEKYQGTKSKVYSAPTPNSAEAAELAKAKMKVRQQRERRAKKMHIQKSTQAFAGHALPIATFSLNGNLQQNLARQQPRKRTTTSSARWYGGERKKRDAMMRPPRYRISLASDKSRLDSVAHKQDKAIEHSAEAAVTMVESADPDFSPQDPLLRYHHHHRVDRRQSAYGRDFAGLLSQSVSKQRPGGTIPKLGSPTARSGRVSPPHMHLMRGEIGHAGSAAATPPCSPRDLAYEQLARNINALVQKSPIERHINVINSNASRWLKQQSKPKPTPKQRTDPGGLVIKRVREERERARQMSRERAIRLLNNIL